MSSSVKLLTLLTILSKLLITATQERCISEYFLEKDNSVFTCDFQGINKNVDKMNNEPGIGFRCVHFLGLPSMEECGEVGLRFKLFSNAVNTSISLRYFSNINREVKYEIIEMDGKYGWNHWSKIICADFRNGLNLYVQSSMSIQLDRMLLFMNPQQISDAQNQGPKQKNIKHYTCDDNNISKHNSICDPEVQYFGWKVTAIILIIVTVGSLILVVSLSVTMPYNVWDKPKIQILPVRLTDGAIASNY